ncbi:Crp/Fnr family transcriptional regulator [Hymenobacter fodinae]|uniref:Crp/Fnr family transcriptional regulator n=1 Tax=Hymenobacter fodinae TaxID=2510796 RepID=A0A4Z0P1I6_9BACT|nr:Crp/Fnr family transcriptional regulator [Hymenobacter fodinae]TGE03784.1 Crp/Fnr family transcriptional regulator [Hymenobacter fodinae]
MLSPSLGTSAPRAFRTYVDSLLASPISDADLAAIGTVTVPKHLKKRGFLLQAGEVCKHFAFVLKGALRMYSLNDKGGEHLLSFGLENGWIADRESCVLLTPSAYYIDALEDSDLLLLTHAQLQALIRTVPAMAELMRELERRHEVATQKRLHAAISCTAEERYAAFVTQHPDYLSRFPHHLIASYLGILPETLSRIRAKQLRSNALPIASLS